MKTPHILENSVEEQIARGLLGEYKKVVDELVLGRLVSGEYRTCFGRWTKPEELDESEATSEVIQEVVRRLSERGYYFLYRPSHRYVDIRVRIHDAVLEPHQLEQLADFEKAGSEPPFGLATACDNMVESEHALAVLELIASTFCEAELPHVREPRRAAEVLRLFYREELGIPLEPKCTSAELWPRGILAKLDVMVKKHHIAAIVTFREDFTTDKGRSAAFQINKALKLSRGPVSVKYLVLPFAAGKTKEVRMQIEIDLSHRVPSDPTLYDKEAPGAFRQHIYQ